ASPQVLHLATDPFLRRLVAPVGVRRVEDQPDTQARIRKIGQKKPPPVTAHAMTTAPFTTKNASRWARNSLFLRSRTIARSRRSSPVMSFRSFAQPVMIRHLHPKCGRAAARRPGSSGGASVGPLRRRDAA